MVLWNNIIYDYNLWYIPGGYLEWEYIYIYTIIYIYVYIYIYHMYIVVYCTLVLVSYNRHSLCHIDIKQSNRYHHTGNARNFIHRAFCSKVLPSLGINSSAPTVSNGFTRTAQNVWGDLNNVATWILWVLWILWIAPHSVHHHPDHSRPDRSHRTCRTGRTGIVQTGVSGEFFGKRLENVWECQTCQTCQRLHVLEPMHRPVILGQKLAMHSWHFTVCALWLTVTPENTSLATLPLQIRQADLKVFDGTNILQILIIQPPANIIK